ncbi:MAG: 2-hydroxyglutaryl-CoA dehydratase [Clostridiales bacterium]|nr:2-hydroxyglutaryl-CoA dehydratase [Clostridiales bacterium]
MDTILEELSEKFGDCLISAAVTGSGGIALSAEPDMPFVQEVIAGSRAVRRFMPEVKTVLELGGEDAKLTFLENGLDQRMNGICAGGTGAFIDQMALLLKTDPEGLDMLAAKHTTVYPIAARCGVFAKTDLQALLNEGARREDIAASVFQAVVNQTISGLACGRKIRGKCAFLGGPLFFLPQLRHRFQLTLGLGKDDIVLPRNAQVYVAVGAALSAKAHDDGEYITFRSLLAKIRSVSANRTAASARLDPLFQTEADYHEFLDRHSRHKVELKDLFGCKGGCFLGLDIGSTTCKAALIDEDADLLFSCYADNDGSPLDSAAGMLRKLYESLPSGAFIARTCVTGYGENLIKTAFSCDMGEVETAAHFTAADFFLPGVETVLDIGGQDMKFMRARDGIIESIVLNEACSSGCRSFIETFAKSLGLDVRAFSDEGVGSLAPVDLGSRCTVFMNSRVRQAQKDGIPVGDISAGLCYSAVKNALFKVIKMRHPSELGEKIIVQGGAFKNDALLRCFELIAEKEAVRPDIAELMGAFGAALTAKNTWVSGTRSALIGPEALSGFSYRTAITRCRRCDNQCLLTITGFSGGQKLVTGNRCEKGAGMGTPSAAPNLYAYKYQRLFQYAPLEEEKAKRGTMGIPRALNMYENYPFWFTFFTELGFRVVLSPPSSRVIYELGMDTISSDTACYPAKLSNGHVAALINQGVKHIFFPCLPKEKNEFQRADNHYNCPIVACYAEVLHANIDLIREKNVSFYHPFLPYHNDKKLARRLWEELRDFDISEREIARSIAAARKEDLKFKDDISRKGREILDRLAASGRKGIVLSGRPYHLDPEVHHGIPELIASLGFAVLTEDSVAGLGHVERPLRVLDQWMYHTRLYEAADYVSKSDCLELVQLNSFGCGPDSIAAEQAQEILSCRRKLYTLIKIDEVSNLGAVKIRLRSLQTAIKSRQATKAHDASAPAHSLAGTSGPLNRYTIIGPQMSPIHFELLEEAIRSEGYNFVILPTVSKEDIDEGLRYVNNDSCYPAIIIIGQILSALKSGKYDIGKTAVMITQTGGPCRASNYLALLDMALQKNGLESVPLLSLTLGKSKRATRFPITPGLFKKAVMSMIYGDLLMKVLYRVRPYECVPGTADCLYDSWLAECRQNLRRGDRGTFRSNLAGIASDFNQIEITGEEKTKVGLVGEIMVKYHPAANNNMAELLEQSGAELAVPGLTDFFLYCALFREYNYQYLDGGNMQRLLGNLFIRYVESYRDDMRKALQSTGRFKAPDTIFELAGKIEAFLSPCNHTGEGWLLTAEIVDLIAEGADCFICMQPFACLPNPISGRGMIKTLKEKYPHIHMIAIDYDPGASNVNQINRIRLMLESSRTSDAG